MGTPDLINKTILKVVHMYVLLSEIIPTKESHLSVKLKISKVAIMKNAMYSKEKSHLG